MPGAINLASFYVVGIPLCALLAFGLPELKIGLPALWMGLDAGMFTMVVGLACYFSRLDWELEASERVLPVRYAVFCREEIIYTTTPPCKI